ncbi:DUF1445-domain-containing protein [Saccharata proteae CBS 121410]|uniref:DUF1445-domain-containing protein n=1 Tax=Saccharata proteae CBS 121410 TaxID=1314787 RepID=A0A6A5YFE0_9PEZI|nr:DUF1445-domain-containing protein [Saccharata proteae CBS 121410]
MGSVTPATTSTTAHETRLAARVNTVLSTSGLAPSYIQANLIVLPSRFADPFRLLCHRNPVPCPLLASSAHPGDFSTLKSHLPNIPDAARFAHDLDLRTDAPRYMVYQDGALVKSKVPDVFADWTDDHVAFLIGCSYSFETALTAAGLPPRHTLLSRVVPMYRTKVPLHPAGVFTGATMVVSMRPYRRQDVETARTVTRAYEATHGEPVAWGWEALEKLGIDDINRPDWGDKSAAADGVEGLRIGDEQNVPVFWGCGVTPQEAVMRAKLPGTVMGHAPGHMVVLDVKDEDVFNV